MMYSKGFPHIGKSRIKWCVVQYTNHLWFEMSNTEAYKPVIFIVREAAALRYALKYDMVRYDTMNIMCCGKPTSWYFKSN